jgi:predicted ATPase
VTAQRERLRQLALHALHELVDYHTAQGEYAAGIDACTRLLQFDPWREDAHRQLMLLLALSGQRSAALAQYDICRRVLDEELGDEPSEETTALRERILADEFAGQHEAALSQAAGTPQTPVRPPVYQLPVPPTPLVGRMTELIQASAQLLNPTCRLLTLLGPGGVGKTRLALEVAHTCAATDDRPSPFVHGVYFVPLAALAAPDAVDDVLATTIASVLQIPLSGPETAAIQVLQYLRGKAVLLVLDNFEHLMAGASFVSSLLQSAPSLKILVTSRERLNVRGERVVELDGLAFPPQQRLASVSALEQFSAIQLFVQTAQSTTPNFVLTEETTSAVLRICQLVGGLPLAIELAATWTRMLTCSEIADELAQNLDFLNSATPDLPPRQQSLRAVFASSWGLLAPPEQHVLQQLSIFQGSFARAAATAVTGASLPALAALVDKTLVRRANSENSRETRYELLAVLRQYAAEHLEATGETAATASRHATYYLALLAGLAADLRGRGQQAALKQISGEIDDVRAAWRWAVTQQDHRAMARAADSLFHFYYIRSWFAEGAAVFEMAAQALAMHRTDTMSHWFGARCWRGRVGLSFI